MIYAKRISSPIGPLLLLVEGDALCGLYMEDHARGPAQDPAWREEAHPLLDKAEQQLAEYFAGTRQAFDLPLRAKGTYFMRQVWDALVQIPYGETATYGALARQLGKPGAARAVARANALNPISIVVPCHRVIGSSGKLTGYAGGLDRKETLLERERRGLTR